MANLNALINISVQNQALLQQVNAQFNQLNQTVGRTNQAVNKLAGGFRNLLGGVISIATLRQAVNEFAALEKAETNLTDALTRNTKLSDGFVKSLRRQATELGRAGGFTRAQVTQLQGYTAVLGLAEDKTLDLNAAIVSLSQRSTAGIDEIAKSVQRAIVNGEISETLGPLIGAPPGGFDRLTTEQRASFITNSQSSIFSNNNFSRLFATLRDAIAEFARVVNFAFGPAIRAFTDVVGRLNETGVSGSLLAGGAGFLGILGLGKIREALGGIAKALGPILTRVAKLSKLGGPIAIAAAAIFAIGQFFVGLVEGLLGIDNLVETLVEAAKTGISAIGDAFEILFDKIQEGLDGLVGLGRAIGEAFRTGNFSGILEAAAFYQEQRQNERAERERSKASDRAIVSQAELARINRSLTRSGVGIQDSDRARRAKEIEQAEKSISNNVNEQVRAYQLQASLLHERKLLLEAILKEEQASPLLSLEANGNGEFSKQQLENYERQAKVVGEIEEQLKGIEIQLKQNAVETKRFLIEAVRIRDGAKISTSEAEGRSAILGASGTFSDAGLANQRLQLGLIRERIKLTQRLIRMNEGQGDVERVAQLKLELVGLQEQMSVLEKQIPQLGTVVAGDLGSAFDSIIDGTKSVKDSFSDMVRSILSDITKLLARAAVLGLVGGASNTEAGASAGGLFGSLLNYLSGGRNGAYNGGIATTQGILGFNRGGMVPGPSISRDIIPAMLTPGEIVLNAAQQRRVASNIVSESPSATIINAIDNNDILNAIAERQGQNVILNSIRGNRQQTRRMLG